MQAASTPPPEPPVEPKWSHEESADEDLSVTRCARQSERGIDSTVMDTSNDTDILVAAKEVKIEVTSIKDERPESPSVPDEDPLSCNTARPLKEEEKFRCRSPTPPLDFIGFTEVDRDSACFISNAKTILLSDYLPSDKQNTVEIFAEGEFIKSQRLVINYRDVDGLDDGNIFCELCCRDRDGECLVHGPLEVVHDTKARPGIGDPERDVKTLPQSLSSGPNTGVLAEKNLPARQRFGPYEGTLTTDEPRTGTAGYRWKVKKGDRVHHSVNAEDPSCSNWLRRVNCARSEEEQNLVAFQHKGQIYFRTSKPIPRGSELLVYYGDDSARELTVHSETSGEPAASPAPGPSSSGSTLQCPHCDFNCLGQKRLDKHLKTRHGHLGNKGRFQCEWCQYSAEQPGHLREHRRTHTGERRHGCSVCPARFTKRGTLNKHMRTHTGERPFRCSICPARFADRSNLKNHMTIHVGERPYQCDVCRSSFLKRSHLVRHARLHSEARPYVCSICPARFTQQADLKAHMRTHPREKQYTCDRCSSRYSTRAHLNVHMRTHTGERPYQCDKCPSRFITRAKLNRHIWTHTEERPYQCYKCPSRYFTRTHLNTHMRIHAEVLPYQCDKCPTRFFTETNLNKHMRIHKEKRSHGCSTSAAQFTLRKGLTTHVLIHTGERPYGCSSCPARFAHRSELTTHMRTHTGDRPYQCDECPSSFVTQANLISHARIHTEGRRHGCSVCPARFTQLSDLGAHMRIHMGERPFD
ncbi:zinc finger protein 2-like isoform X1 [Amphibalanus amphitrite]|uniref:zinc finger protein 2-like isoform X1 n=1 Tax=Amphibalanus amphitrite TaxID=1232801 RepID=UPI001C90FEE4|nr:zinc finger protein 2-like isoform X1 [Amphibalanus amphitrite]XP_043228342.1 zinc finger protein 2-like isoform X1 [Amphibalanus amphitrite]XP_043228343.1 zinc finger protein 2-like isoform X1 [Amphibalanus amphitrite]XP_043228345.1 zinc finger protein 2-like isoform X1 [Amphibalanus amphitrite]